ncbi:uncharacterized protein MYCFIDRAFT_209309 [Pseudocercospora fijiensis CIRAD86]|uniref:Uncharacterized protein n=1 Tax=Pseudocercospora fijiensis (strain CIRAD86) TaxID=383855 RepID=M3AJF2_PSEFD|nr:uncharacterized protein MYCFIDRAFT_209309 [Pseudocercospora fijiensis CIRAD86]EME77283.1 hypothetical protein MYCFIDRAFT_209309 [Pseudocercospora fijiensis CIRAD86]
MMQICGLHSIQLALRRCHRVHALLLHCPEMKTPGRKSSRAAISQQLIKEHLNFEGLKSDFFILC